MTRRTFEQRYARDCEKEPTYSTRRPAPSSRYRFGLARWLCHGCQHWGAACICPAETDDPR